MKQYVDKSAIIAEIDALQDTTMENGHFLSSYHEGIFDGLSKIENFLDTIETKEATSIWNDARKTIPEDGSEQIICIKEDDLAVTTIGKLVHGTKKWAYLNDLLNISNVETKEVDLDNNGWIDCAKRMPPEEKQYSDTLQGHREWTESDLVLAWDSLYGCRVDATKNGKWMSEQRGGYTGQVVHGIIAWRPIPEFSEELL